MKGSEELRKEFDKVLKAANEMEDIIKNDKDKFLSGLSKFYEYLDSLTVLQESSLLHVVIFLVIIISLINIISVLFANEIIKYFNLENRFPKLAILFKLRIKLQKYYLFMSFTVLFIMCILGLVIDFLLFFTK